MDYYNLQSEYDEIFKYSKIGINTLNDFLLFLKTYVKYSEQLYSNTKKTITNIISGMLKISENNQSSLTIRCFEFYNSFLEYLNSINKQNNKIEYDILNPLNEYISHIKTQNSLIFTEFKDIINETYKQKKNYEQSKHNYIESSRKATEQENLIIKKIDEKEKNLVKEKDVTEANNKLLKLKEIALSDNEKYKIEYEKSNKKNEETNKLYFPLSSKIKEIENSKSSMTKFYFEQMNDIFKNILKSSQEFINLFISRISEINTEKDMELFEQKFNYIYKSNTRIPKEELLNYDIYRRNIESMIQKNKMLLKKENSSLYPSQETFSFNSENQKFIFSSEETMIIDGLFLDSDVDNFKFENLCKKTLTKFDYGKDFIDKILERYTKVIALQVSNEDNFDRLSTILNTVVNNKKLQKDIFEINFAICYISEKTFYQNESNPFYKIYLCKLLSEKNPKMKSKAFWKSLLELKINSTITQKAEKSVKKEFREEEKKENQNLKKSNTVFKTFIDVKKFFNVNEKIDKMKQFKEKFDKYCNENKKSFAIEILRDFILHFSYFNLDLPDIVEIITETSVQYGFTDEKDKIKFFMAVINSNLYSIKNLKIEMQKPKIYFIKKDESKDNFMNKNFLKKTGNKDNKTLILLNTLKYLTFPDYINLICLDKKTNKIITRVIYKNLLLNSNLSISKKRKIPDIQNLPELRIKIWKNLLHFKPINYKEILSKIGNEQLPSFSLIDLDVVRMWFDEGLEDKRKSITNILYALSYLHKEIIYSQGMNYITEFLLLFTNNEEETFFIFNSLLQSTDYADLFVNELKRLNKYFYVFDRLINIYLPEVNIHLKNQQVSVTFYISPWFITLFMSAFHYVTDQKDPKVLIWIFDLFVLYGWKAVIKIGLCLLKHFENKILTLNGESLLSFLINDMLKLDFFQTNNYDKLRKIYSSFKLENGLIGNLENEYELKQKIE